MKQENQNTVFLLQYLWNTWATVFCDICYMFDINMNINLINNINLLQLFEQLTIA